MESYKPVGVCAKEIKFEVEDNKVKEVKFRGGCSGNLEGISQLIIGMEVEEAIKRLKGIKCGFKSSSCPDQLALALEKSLH